MTDSSPLTIINFLSGFLDGWSNPSISSGQLPEYGLARFVRLEDYFGYWRDEIKAASRAGRIMSNGWAFSTLSGIASYEKHIRTTEFRSIYFNKTQEVIEAVSAIMKNRPRKIGGFMIYGYGNLLRESYFIERAIDRGLVSRDVKIVLLDCSFFYRIYALSSLNPLLEVREVEPRMIKAELIDYLDDTKAPGLLKEWRKRLNTSAPTVHLLLGNTFCNSESEPLITALNAATLPRDYVVAEYANYPSDHFLADPPADYVSEMAKMAASEIFSCPPDDVSAENFKLSDTSIATKITILDKSKGNSLSFQSMLRRRFHPSEILDGLYSLEKRDYPLESQLVLDTYRRTEMPA
jgi:hypothetical protein